MTASPELHRNRARALSFGSVAAEYDRARPGYPDALIVELLGRGPRDALDVGCGTGKAARQLAAHGLPVLGVEVDPAMAEVARSHGIEVEVGAFETWDDAGRRFDLLTCGQAWHWVDPEQGAAKARQIVRPGGAVSLFWNRLRHDEEEHAALQEVYRRIAPELADAEANSSVSTERAPAYEALAAAGFVDLVEREFPWERAYRRDEWLALISTFSDHHLLPADQWQRLADGLAEVIDARGGVVHARYRTICVSMRAPAGEPEPVHEEAGEGVQLLPVPEVAELLGVKASKVHQHVRDGQLLLVRRPDGVRGVPASLIQDGAVVKHLPSVITQLRDARFGDDEIVEWLHRADDTLPGSPIQALRENRGAEVKRRAQVAGY